MRIGAVVAVASLCAVLAGCSARVSPVAAAQGSCSLSPAQEFAELQPYVRAMAAQDVVLALDFPAAVHGAGPSATMVAAPVVAQATALGRHLLLECPSDPDGANVLALAQEEAAMLERVVSTFNSAGAPAAFADVVQQMPVIGAELTVFGISLPRTITGG